MNTYSTKSRVISLLLILAALVATACAGTETTGDTTSADTEAATTTEKVELPPFDKDDYEGAKFHILAPEWGLYDDYFFAEDQNGETMNDAIYNREATVEEYLGVDITHACEGTIQEIATKMNTAVMSGDDIYQLVLTHCISGIQSMMTQGLLFDWNDFEYCDLSEDYWNQSAIEKLQVNGQNFYMVSDYMLPDPNGILFNKDMVTDFKLENPYTLVREGKWTLDKMLEMASKVSGDLNGDSVFDINDRYGVGCEDDWEWNSFIYSSGLSLVDIDKDGSMTLAINDERMVTLIEKLDQLINKTDDAFIWKYGSAEEDMLRISSGKVLFEIIPLNRLNIFRETTVDFGIIPYPKFDEAQERYLNNDWSGLMCIPSTVGNPEMVGKVNTLLAYYSDDEVIPAYYDIVLGEKLSRDEDSKEMLDLIYSNIVFDSGMNFFGFSTNMQKLFYTVKQNVIANANGNFASWFATYGEGAKGEIETFIEEAAKLGQ